MTTTTANTAARKPRPRKPAGGYNSPATKAQKRYAADLAWARGYSNPVEARQDMLGTEDIGSLWKREMSELIDWLKQAD